MAHSVFISYSDKDKDLAQRFLRALEGQGCKCWIAPRDIRPGASYAESILIAIEKASDLVLIFTEHSNVSPHVLREVEQALRLRKNIMPIRCDDAPVSKALDYLLATVQWISARPQSAETAIDQAAAQIEAAVSPEAGPTESAPNMAPTPATAPAPAPVHSAPASHRPSSIGKIALVVLAGVGVVTLALVAWRSMRGPSHAPAVGDNILAAENGGRILVGSSANWTGTIDGREDQVFWFSPRDEGVYGFRNGQPATFSRFQVLIPDSDSHNLREFEVLAGNDSPVGQFKPIGKFTTRNTRASANDGYQQFEFAPVTAKYIKVRLLSPYDANDQRICLYEFRLFGAVADAAASPTPIPAETAAVNLLSADNGGAIASAPNENWRQTVDDKDEQIFWFEPREEAVYRFKGESPATFTRFGVLVPDNDEHNLKEFELFAGNDSPKGEFRSLGKFTTHNARVGPDGYQEFKLPPTTAKYLKVRLLAPHSANDQRIYLYEFRLFGEPAG